MESAILGLILDSSVIIEAERKGQTVEQLLERVHQVFGEVEIAICSVTVAELVHGVYRANTPESIHRRVEASCSSARGDRGDWRNHRPDQRRAGIERR